MTQNTTRDRCLFLALALLLSLLTGCKQKAEAAQAPPLPPIDLAAAVGRVLPPMGEVRRAGSALSEDEQRLYAGMVRELDALSEEISFSGEDIETVERVWSAILADYPEFFWLSGAGQWGGWESLSYLWFQPEYTTPADELPARRRQAEAVCDELLARAEGMTDYERALFFHDSIVESTGFDTETAAQTDPLTGRASSRSAYGCLVNHLAVCSGYAKAFQWLAQRSGMDCMRVNGTAKDDDEGHEWNCIRLGGDYYYIDITWDDPVPEDGGEQTLTHEYFCITTDELLQTHELADGQDLPVCSATDCDYYRMQGLYFEEYDESPVGEQIRSLVDAGEEEFSFKFGSGDECARAMDELFENQVFFEYADSLDSVSYRQSENGRILYFLLS